MGLSRTKKVLHSKYMYNEIGTRIYEEIMNMEEYYLVKAEHNALELAKEELYKILNGSSFNLIELGAGNAVKTKILLKFFKEKGLDFTYIPVDISESAIKDLIDSLEKEIPNLNVNGMVADYFDAMEELKENTELKSKNFVLFLGSNIGNLTFEDATAFIFSLWRVLNKDDLFLIGFDLRKSIQIMLNAYNDSEGITSKFNLNLLSRINEDLGGNFNIEKFFHYEPYNVQTGAMESYLISKGTQEVYIKAFDKVFLFEEWEPIFVEWSYKYTKADILNLASITGFKVEKNFYDVNKYFIDSLWCVNRKDGD